MLTDLELINQVKELNDSSAISELINRHTGIYLSVVSKYCNMSSGKLSFQDLSDEKAYNIYKYAQDYDPNRGCKFSTHVGNMARFTCLDALSEEPVVKECIDDLSLSEQEKYLSSSIGNVRSEIKSEREAIDEAINKITKDSKFKEILLLRHPAFSPKPMNWADVGKKVGMSHEGARKLYRREIEKIKNYLKNK